jgi:hypothetical protein
MRTKFHNGGPSTYLPFIQATYTVLLESKRCMFENIWYFWMFILHPHQPMAILS